MSYSLSLENAAQRHFDAGEHLYNNSHRKDVAGYLYGISAECAIKEIMSKIGFNSSQLKDRRNNPLYAHFPELKTLLRNHMRGRNSLVFKRFIEDRYMQEWDVKMRYASSGDIDARTVGLWREHARIAIQVMYGTLWRK